MATLLAEFEIENGQPAFVQGSKHKHYRIRLFLEGVPQDAITVRYQLDPTYKNPIRIVSAGAPQFNEFTTAYGDYLIQVSMRNKSDPNYDHPLTSGRLAEALQTKYAGTANPSISVAIQEIAAH